MGFLSRFENKMEDTLEGAADRMFDAPISPVQIAKKAEKQMRRNKMVGAGREYAPTLYTVLVNVSDDERLFGYYPTLAGETETYLAAKAHEEGLVMDGQPLVRFIPDEGLKHGKFEVIAEAVAAPIVAQLRDEEMERYGIAPQNAYARQANYGARNAGSARATGDPRYAGGARNAYGDPRDARGTYGAANDPYAPPAYDMATSDPRNRPGAKPPLPYVPEDEIDRSIDYGEYTFNSQDFEDYRQNGPSSIPLNDNASNNYYDDGYDDYAPAGNAPASGYARDGYAPADDYAPEAADYGDPFEPASTPSARSAVEIPQTIAFASGRGNAAAVADQELVRAQLTDVQTDQVYALASSRLIVGRSSTSDITISDINVSRTHAELRYEPQGVWSITDLGSANGTFVNDTKVSTCPLAEGDIITVGMTDLMFSLA